MAQMTSIPKTASFHLAEMLPQWVIILRHYINTESGQKGLKAAFFTTLPTFFSKWGIHVQVDSNFPSYM
jgi:hypothetical protein